MFCSVVHLKIRNIRINTMKKTTILQSPKIKFVKAWQTLYMTYIYIWYQHKEQELERYLLNHGVQTIKVLKYKACTIMTKIQIVIYFS